MFVFAIFPLLAVLAATRKPNSLLNRHRNSWETQLEQQALLTQYLIQKIQNVSNKIKSLLVPILGEERAG